MRLPLSRKIILVVLVGVSTIAFLNVYSSAVRNFFYLISEPFQKPLFHAGQETSEFLQSFFYSREIAKENIELRHTMQELLAKTAKLLELENENKVLRRALEVGLKDDFKLILSQVIGKNIDGDSLIIDKGAQDQVKNGMPVLTQEKTLVGRVEEVYDNFSRVQLVSSKKSSFDGRVLGKEIQGLVKGGGNLRITFDLVPQYEEVKEGELLTTAALSGIFPPGLLIGHVKLVRKSDVEPFQQIEIQPAFDIKQLDYLFIIIP